MRDVVTGGWRPEITAEGGAAAWAAVAAAARVVAASVCATRRVQQVIVIKERRSPQSCVSPQCLFRVHRVCRINDRHVAVWQDFQICHDAGSRISRGAQTEEFGRAFTHCFKGRHRDGMSAVCTQWTDSLHVPLERLHHLLVTQCSENRSLAAQAHMIDGRWPATA